MPVSSSHAATPFRRTARFVAIVAWAALIFGASHRPDLRVSDDDLVDFVLRKAAHLFVFGVLAVLVARAARGEGLGDVPSLVTGWIAASTYAISDEWHQSFIEGRVGHASDVAIDVAGATLALALLHVAWRRTPPPTPPEPHP